MYKNLNYIFPQPSSSPRDPELDRIDAYLKEKVPDSKIVDKYEVKKLPWLPEQNNAEVEPHTGTGLKNEIIRLFEEFKLRVPTGPIVDILYEAHKLLEQTLRAGGESESFVTSLKRFVSLTKINEDNLICDESSRKIIEDNYRATGKIPGCGRNTLYVRCDSRVDTVVGYFVDTYNDDMERSYETGSGEYHYHVMNGLEDKLEYHGPNRWD